MNGTPARIAVDREADVANALAQFESDGQPRVLSRAGKDIAVILSPAEYAALTAEPLSKTNRERLMALAGAWNDIDTDELRDRIYRWRHESPPSHQSSLE